jgi:signal transduction histidine kinase
VEAIEALATSDPDGDRGELAGPFARFSRALDEELKLVASGRRAEAAELAERQASPALAVLEQTVDEELQEHRELARARSANADRLGFYRLGAGAVSLSLLAWMFLLQRRAARRERRYVEELQEHDRLKDSLLATVSHELRTPLTSIRGYLELLRVGEAGELTESQRRLFNVVRWRRTARRPCRATATGWGSCSTTWSRTP